MLSPLDKHQALTAVRTKAYEEFFGCEPSATFPPHALFKKPDERFLIDIFVYTVDTDSGEIEVAVTNGMSDQRMVDAADSDIWSRHELIQYFPKCTEGHARRLHNMAWLPLLDGFLLGAHHSITWDHPAVAGTPWRNGFFLTPLIKPHRTDVCEVEGDSVSVLWHVPISDEELAYKKEYGADALIDRLGAVELPWVFDENNRPDLLAD